MTLIQLPTSSIMPAPRSMLPALSSPLTRIQQLIAARPDLFARQASVVATWRTVGARRLGPYFSLRYRDGRRQCSIYLGASNDLTKEVRGLIAEAKRARLEQLTFQRMRAAVKASLRVHMRDVRRQLEPIGLTLKGFEIRGWRNQGQHVNANPTQSSYEPAAEN